MRSTTRSARFLLVTSLLASSAYAQSCVSWVLRNDGSVSSPSRRATVCPLAYDPGRADIVLFGGQYSQGSSSYSFYNDLWSWKGSSWSRITAVGASPLPRSSSGIAFDRVRDRLVIFGGYRSDTPRGRDTWEFNRAASTWANVSNSGPSGRYEPAMTYDEARGVCVLFGGNDGTYNSETWTWNGTTWTLRTTTTRPPGRMRANLAYDSVRGVAVLFGGQGTAVYTDTWEWNGSAWAQRATSGPPARIYQAMAFDRDRHVMVLHGGSASPLPPGGDVWEWNGTAWSPRVLPGPTSRYAHGIAYDEAQREIVIFGGLSAAGGGGDAANFRDTWVYTSDELGLSPVGAQRVCPGGEATFSVTAYSDQPAAYSWSRNGTPLSDGPTGTGSAISGSGTRSLTITLASISDEDLYECTVTNGCGSATSIPAPLSICIGEFNCDGGVDGADIEVFFNAWEAGEYAADVNQDGGVDGADVEFFFAHWEAGC